MLLFAQGKVYFMLEQDYHSWLISANGTESCSQALSLYPSEWIFSQYVLQYFLCQETDLYFWPSHWKAFSPHLFCLPFHKVSQFLLGIWINQIIHSRYLCIIHFVLGNGVIIENARVKEIEQVIVNSCNFLYI